LKFIFSSLLFLLIPIFSEGQKVALVLSGGGAKGLAHVSILKALEQNNIPIDYVVGTSMGAVIGGFYAAGYTPEEIEEIVLSKDFQSWVNGQAGDDYNYHYTSKDPDPTIFTIGLDVKESISASFKNTFANDAIINYKLTEYLAQASQISGNSFDSLFVPYRAIAAEIFTQEEIVLKDGLLSEAVRASMAVPFFYNPVRVKNDKLLFDGGIYNNFPVDVARKEFNPDIIIGVNVSTAAFQEYPYEEDEKLVDQNLFLYILNKSNLSLLNDQDIYVEPDLKGMNGADFAKVGQLLDSGHSAILKKIPEIKEKIEHRTDSLERLKKRTEFLGKAIPLNINSVQFRGFDSKQVMYLSNIFQLRKQSMLNMEDVRKSYFKLISEDFFNKVYPKISFDAYDSSYVFELTGSSDNSFKIDFGGYLTTRSFSELFLGFRFNTFNKNLAEHALQLYTGRFYQSINYYSRFNIPGKNLFYIEPQMTYNKWDYIDISDIILKDNIPSYFVQQNDLKLGINIGVPVGLKYKLIFSAFNINNGDQYSNTQELQSTDILDELKIDGLKTEITLSRNSLNRILYPDEGKRLALSATYFYGKERYSPGTTSISTESRKLNHSWIKLYLQLEEYYRISRKFYSGWLLESVFSTQPFFSNYQGTLLNTPAFYPLNESRTRILPELRSFKYIAGGLRSIYKPVKKIDIRLEGYIFKPLESLIEIEPQVPGIKSFDNSIHFVGTLNVVYHSPIGPVSLGMNYYSPLVSQWSVMLHIGYLLFNKRSIE